MFPYYGRKAKLGPLYPAPVEDHVIEPFAGSAAYSLIHRDRQVTLIDKDPVITGIWAYLVQAARRDILALPILAPGERIDESHHSWLAPEERWLIGFFINQASSVPKKTATKRTQWNESSRARVARLVDEIRHWRVINGDYTDAPPGRATWFIDPPYAGRGGTFYRASCSNRRLDYVELARWVDCREGQVIVCENEEASWLPFSHLASHHSVRNVYKREVLYYRPAQRPALPCAA